MNDLGFKNITLENWLKPDDISLSFAHISPIDGTIKPIKGDYWVRYILEPKLREVVPTEVQKLLEVARGAIIYGYFFYPLYSLAWEQLFRVAESAISHKCKAIRAPKSIKTFNLKVKHLLNKKVIPPQDITTWNAIRKLRNSASHPKNQMIIPPGSVITTLERIVEQINSLFL